MDTPQLTNAGRSNLLRKTTALLEVLGILIAGSFVSGKVMSFLGIKPLGSLFQSVSKTSEPDFIALSIGWLKIMFVQYACLLSPAFVVGWWRRRFRVTHYGVTTAGQPVLRLVVLGFTVFALVALPLKLLWVAKRSLPLGSGPAFWALLDKSWTPSFWLFLAVSSFGITPVLEELFYRGYCQTRLEEEFGGMGAIVIVTLFMTLGHNQYHQLNALSIGTIIALIPIILGMGYVYWRSRSLVPAIILHMIVNFPTKAGYDFILPALMAGSLILFPTKWLNMVRDFYSEWTKRSWKKTAFPAAAVATVLVVGFESWPVLFTEIGFLCIGAALWLECRDRKLSQ